MKKGGLIVFGFFFKKVWNLPNSVACHHTELSDLLVGSENTHDSSQDEMKFNDSSDNNDDDNDDGDDSSGSESNSESDEGIPFTQLPHFANES